MAERDVLGRLDKLVVLREPLHRLARVDEREGEGADAMARGLVDGLALGAGNPYRRVRLLHWLGDHLAARDRKILALVTGGGGHHQDIGGLAGGFEAAGMPLVGMNGKARALRCARATA